ncbi:phosphate acyltransferase PlsX [Pseudoflavitalea sp. G-6-1-2]|uniref:phosphate acyltransferase PlsX n=1 Tax=Pseudoflavitalea sp. G-6-1-2 TaxID=2728841 RepID=UPI00146A6062|nr:phosphate acyltransferase PlsX [Pseudoflavitalea sp. G-6-1-2]NML21922.1 phosphate acyltransferase PlsX [Pseudoflavitalea sp. G-6-1-2]
MIIGLDMMGGDFAPREAVKGIHLYFSETKSPATLLLTGDEAQINPLLQEFNIPADKVKVVHTTQVIDMNEHPTKALKEKQDSSIAVGFYLLATGKSEAFISAGNTGAMLVGAMYSIKAIDGVQRPTISTLIPKDNGKMGVLLDVGLNADCKPEHLNQFAILGSLYAQHILGIDNPRVALVNIGEEEGKGNILAQATYPLLKENTAINFTGNVEGRDIFLDKADVMVCEGFTGNVILKMAESFYEITHAKNIQHEYLDRFNFENYGGTPVLGVAKPVIIGHGISHAKAFSNMIKVAEKMIASDLLSKMKSSFDGKSTEQ